MNKLKLHVVSRADFIKKQFPDFQDLLNNHINPNDIPTRFYCGRGVWAFQTLLALNYYYNDKIECSYGSECRPDAINLMHNDDYGSRVKPWKGVTVVARADRPPIIGADYVVEQNPEVANIKGRIYIPHWPQPGVKPRIKENYNVETVGYFGRVDSFPPEYANDDFRQRLANAGIELRLSYNNWTDYQDVDVCLSFRKEHDHKLARKPASKLINAWLGGTVMVCDDEPSFHAIRNSDLDYLIAKTPDETVDAILQLKNNPELYQRMHEHGQRRLKDYSREAVAAQWFALFESVWHKGLHTRPELLRMVRFAFGKLVLPLTRKL